MVLTSGSAVAQKSVVLAGSYQRDQNQVQDWTQETGLEGGTGFVAARHLADSSLLLPYPSGSSKD